MVRRRFMPENTSTRLTNHSSSWSFAHSDAQRPACSTCIRSHKNAVNHAPPGAVVPPLDCTFDELPENGASATPTPKTRYEKLESRIREWSTLACLQSSIYIWLLQMNSKPNFVTKMLSSSTSRVIPSRAFSTPSYFRPRCSQTAALHH